MTTTFEVNHPRAAAGTFTDKPQSEPESSLAQDDRFVAVKSHYMGRHTVQSEQTHPAPTGNSFVIQIGGAPHVNQRFGAALRLVSQEERETARAFANRQAADGGRMTISLDRGNQVEIVEGTGGMLRGNDGFEPVLFIKGSKKKFFGLNDLNLIGAVAHYGRMDELADRFNDTMSAVPVTEPVTFEGIPEYELEDEDDENAPETTIAAAFLIEGPDFGNGREPGCMFLATDIQSEDGIVNGYFWSPDDAGLLTSESGSFYTKDMDRKAGRIRDYEAGSLTFKDAWSKLSEDRASGYRELLGR